MAVTEAAADLALSRAVARVKPSATFAVTTKAAELRAEGRDVIGLGAGEPDFDTPDHIKQAAVDAIASGKTKYTPADGAPELKDAVCAKFERDNALSYERSQIHVSTGGKTVLFNALIATVNPGDEVVIPAPYWVSYPEMVRLCGGEPVIVDAAPETGWKVTPESLRRVLGPAVKWVILNSPSNPTGAAYTADELRALADVVLDHPNVWLLVDDMYEHLVYDGFQFSTIAQVEPRLISRTLTVNGVSKAYAMTGWRIGFAGGPEPLIAAMRKVAGQTTSNPCSISQAAAVAALNGPHDFLPERNAVFKERRDLCLEALNAAPGVFATRPEGAFYIFAGVRELMGKASRGGAALLDDVAFATALLEEEGVAVVPGSAFGYAGAFRISYATSTQTLHDAMARIRRFCDGIR